MDKRKKLLYQLDTPYSTVSWPTITLEDQDTILGLLCSLLAPLGQYRAQHVNISKGRRDKKRKRKESATSIPSLPSPPAPELRSYVDVGLSIITRRLQESAVTNGHAKPPSQNQTAEDDSPACPYSAIFVSRSGQPNVLTTHLPQMVAVASKAYPDQIPIRLVGLSKACEERLSQSLGIPRVSCIGLHHNAPNSEPLVDFTREHVPDVDIRWLEEARQAEHQETKINTIETTIGSKKQGNRR